MHWSSLLSSQRIGSTKATTGNFRSAFEQDYDRIIFSHPFRRLQDKTQVHPLPEHDFVHTRLTHSLEVSSVGRSLGKKVGEVVLDRHKDLSEHTPFDFGAIVAAASLAHDLGNPPFGHSGEDGISDFFTHHRVGQSFQPLVSESEWADLIQFEGNAQGFRILNKNQYKGLHLTYATLGAFTKYPCPARFDGRDRKRKSQKKYGYFQTESGVFEEVANRLELNLMAPGVWCRHPLAFLVEAADDICYNVIDLEDGCRLGLVSFDDTVELLAGILKESFDEAKLSLIPGQDEKIGVLRALAINKLIDECAGVFVENEADILTGKFDKALTDHCKSSAALEEISSISIEKIYRARHVVEIESAGYEVLPGLMEEFSRAGRAHQAGDASKKYQNLMRLVPLEVRAGIDQAGGSCYLMLRNMIDFVSGMTDRHAISTYRKIKGIALS
ncbi:MAG TPA: deoxyguanosinetriphosphate triphosphohydrolase [Cyclobacteriaceae bacterium]|nr:deoxyguanosinetriphosphate triphosphohydrolase [Cyclobacteriaceae bacterium]